MSRFNSSGAYNFCCRALSDGDYRISWTVDYYYDGYRLRYPRRFSRITDNKGASRFCKNHNIEIK